MFNFPHDLFTGALQYRASTILEKRRNDCQLPVLLLHLGRTGITLDGKELAVHFRGDRGDLGDHVLDALRGCQGGLRCRPIETMRLRVVLY